jgi:hypothetical protein
MPIAFDGEILDLSEMRVGDLTTIDGSELSLAMQRWLAEVDEPDEAYARFNNRI